MLMFNNTRILLLFTNVPENVFGSSKTFKLDKILINLPIFKNILI